MSARRGVVAALAAALAGSLLAGLLAGCAATPVDGTTRLAPGLWQAVVAACVQRAQIPTRIEVLAGPPGSVGVVPVFGDLPSDAQLEPLHRCVSEHPPDATLTMADDRTQRRLLYPWYVLTLRPCLRAEGWTLPAMPSAADFERMPYGAYDPYDAVTGRPGLDLAAIERLQAACPPGPPSVLSRARALAAAGSGG